MDQWRSPRGHSKRLCSINGPYTTFVINENIKWQAKDLEDFLPQTGLFAGIEPEAPGRSLSSSSFLLLCLPRVLACLGAQVGPEEMRQVQTRRGWWELSRCPARAPSFDKVAPLLGYFIYVAWRPSKCQFNLASLWSQFPDFLKIITFSHCSFHVILLKITLPCLTKMHLEYRILKENVPRW